MKKYFIFGLMIAIVPNLCFGVSPRYTQLVREKHRKMAELEKCMGATNGLKIAGVSTLGLTAVGVAGNIAEAKKRDEYADDIESVPKKMEKIQKEIDETNNEIKKLDEESKDTIEKPEIKTKPNGDVYMDIKLDIPEVQPPMVYKPKLDIKPIDKPTTVLEATDMNSV